MAVLGECKCCGIKVSDEAIACPHCGQPNPYTAPDPHVGPWSVILTDAGDNKRNVMLLLRNRFALGLTEAKDLVDNLPQIVRKGMSESFAKEVQKWLSDEGATSELR